MMHFHAQNLYEVGSMFWEGRCWLHVGRTTFHLEWAHGKRAHFAAATLDLGSGDTESEVSLHLALPQLFSWWFSVANLRFARRRERRIGIQIHDGCIWIRPWADPNAWSSTDPWWWDITINVPDLLLGKAKYSQRTLDSGVSIVTFPEGGYLVKWKQFLSEWKRPRWFTSRMVRCELEFPLPIPIPGKGECDWDCGEDAIWSQTSPVNDPGLALILFEQDVLKRRLQYGGPDWRPESRDA